MLKDRTPLFYFSGENKEGIYTVSEKETKAKFSAGICASITLRWIKKTIEGRRILDSSDIGTPFDLNLAYGAAVHSWKSAGPEGHFEVHGLKPVDKIESDLEVYEKEIQRLTIIRGIYCVVLRPLGEKVGHAVGMRTSARINDGGCWFLDPNLGLYFWSWQESGVFVKEVSDFLREAYPSFEFGQHVYYRMAQS